MDAPWSWYQRYNSETPTRNRRGRMGRPSKERKRRLLAAVDHRCVVPGCEVRAVTLDHIVPRADGGTGVDSNLQPMCEPHNVMKGSMSNKDFQALLGLVW